MDNQLGLLISTYEEELQLLERQLDHCLWDGDIDYVSASYCKNAIEYTRGKLYELKLLEDPLYWEKSFQQKNISHYETYFHNANTDEEKDHWTKEISRQKQKLEKLNEQLKPGGYVANKVALYELLEKLLDGKLKNVQLILKREDKFELQFRYSGKRLQITLPHIKQHIKKLYLHSESVDAFRSIGFILEEKQNRLKLSIEGERNNILTKLQPILLKVFFNIIYLRKFANETYVQYSAKRASSKYYNE